MNTSVIVLNSGSSSVKFALYRCEDEAWRRLLSGQIDDIVQSPRFLVSGDAGESIERTLDAYADTERTFSEALAFLIDFLSERAGGAGLAAAGHRVVHGGPRYREPVRVDATVLEDLDALVPLAPLHQPHNLAAIRALLRVAPHLDQVACFDTAFHATQSRIATMFALPRDLDARGVRRYGFHGLSYEYIASVLPDHLGAAADGRVIVAHLGNGSSLCAMQKRCSVATSMGFTALEGLVMGTRPGSLDPGVVLYLMQEMGLNASAISELLYHHSGLLGVSEVSHDMRTLLASADPHAVEAVELYVYRAVTQIGGLAASLGGLDALVFTAGIGEHAAAVRERICRGLRWLGLVVDARANELNGPRISAAGSSVSAWVIPTNEELMIARHALRVASTARSGN